MIGYWDSSSLIEAALAGKSPAGVTRSHTLAECFSNLTGPGVVLQGSPAKVLLGADDAAELLDTATQRLQCVDLKWSEIKKRLKAARAKGVRGGRVHDYLHAAAAEACGAEVIYTLNKKDFADLTLIPIEEAPAKG